MEQHQVHQVHSSNTPTSFYIGCVDHIFGQFIVNLVQQVEQHLLNMLGDCQWSGCNWIRKQYLYRGQCFLTSKDFVGQSVVENLWQFLGVGFQQILQADLLCSFLFDAYHACLLVLLVLIEPLVSSTVSEIVLLNWKNWMGNKAKVYMHLLIKPRRYSWSGRPLFQFLWSKSRNLCSLHSIFFPNCGYWLDWTFRHQFPFEANNQLGNLRDLCNDHF